MARPDFNDPEQRRAYRRELRAVARPWRWLGIALVLCGVGVALVRGEGSTRYPCCWLQPAGRWSSA